jgi:hypothetical protein
MFGPNSSRIASEISGTARQSPSLRPFLQSSLLVPQSSQRIQRPRSQRELIIAATKSHSYEKTHCIAVNLKYGIIEQAKFGYLIYATLGDTAEVVSICWIESPSPLVTVLTCRWIALKMSLLT